MDSAAKPIVDAPCFAKHTVSNPPVPNVDDKTYLEFGSVSSLDACERAADAVDEATFGTCHSVTWHSPSCDGCGARWKLHCYCTLRPDVWLPDIPSMQGRAHQVGVISAKCAEECGGEGWTFSWIVLTLAATYLLVGIAFKYKRGTRGTWQLLPHGDKWRELGALVADGIAFAKTGGGARAAAARPEQRKSQGNRTAADQNSVIGKSTTVQKEKKDKKDQKAKTEKKEKKGKTEKTEHEASLLTASAQAKSAVMESKTTSSGGGGRWVHVPN
eukprot:SAG31_NODE_15_length_37942_cov_32.078297_22_plen_272_part_00